MKISIFSFAVNDKFPIDIAYRAYKKYLKDDFEFILFNDASDPQMEKNIDTITHYNRIKCVKVPQNIHKIHNPSACYARTLNWAIHDYATSNNCEVIVLSHTDVFPICDTSILDILNKNIIASTMEFRLVDGKGVSYIYPALTIINMKLLKDVYELDFGLDPGLDVGGRTTEFIKKNAESIRFIDNYQIPDFLAMPNKNPIAEYFKTDLQICKKYGLSAGWIAEGFYHYMAGSQWNGANPAFAQGHKERMDLFLGFFY